MTDPEADLAAKDHTERVMLDNLVRVAQSDPENPLYQTRLRLAAIQYARAHEVSAEAAAFFADFCKCLPCERGDSCELFNGTYPCEECALEEGIETP